MCPTANDEDPAEQAAEPEPYPEVSDSRSRRRVGRAATATRALIRIGYRDPGRVPERLTLYAAQRLAEPSRDWARSTPDDQPDATRAERAEDLRIRSAKVARIDGAVSGTPFLVALIPGYLAYLWQEARMGLRIAALYGQDPGSLRTAAEMLVLRGVHRDTDAAEQALVKVRDSPLPDKPTSRRPLRTWVNSAYLLLVFGGFLAPRGDPEAEPEHGRLRTIAGFTVGALVFVTTWVLPVTFMLAMAWGCETHTRQLGRRLQLFYGSEIELEAAIAAADRRHDEGHRKRQVLGSAALALSFLIPIGFVAYANHVRQTTGINWIVALGGLVAVSLVIATAVIAQRR